MPEYAVVYKDATKIWIMPHLSVAKRGFFSPQICGENLVDSPQITIFAV